MKTRAAQENAGPQVPQLPQPPKVPVEDMKKFLKEHKVWYGNSRDDTVQKKYLGRCFRLLSMKARRVADFFFFFPPFHICPELLQKQHAAGGAKVPENPVAKEAAQRKRSRENDGKDKYEAAEGSEEEDTPQARENDNTNKTRRLEQEQREGLEAAEKSLALMAARLWDETSKWGVELKGEFKVLYTTLISAGRMLEAMKLAADVAVAAIASHLTPEAELIMNDEDLSKDAKDVFDRYLAGLFDRLRNPPSASLSSAAPGAVAKVVQKGAPKQYPESTVATKEVMQEVLQDYFGKSKWSSENLSSNKDDEEDAGAKKKKKGKRRQKFETLDEKRFFENLGSFLAKRGLIDLEQVTCETPAQQAHWWAAFWGGGKRRTSRILGGRSTSRWFARQFPSESDKQERRFMRQSGDTCALCTPSCRRTSSCPKCGGPTLNRRPLRASATTCCRKTTARGWRRCCTP